VLKARFEFTTFLATLEGLNHQTNTSHDDKNIARDINTYFEKINELITI
jgi:hypothetical protein